MKLHPENGQGMWLPEFCTRQKCITYAKDGQAITPRLVLRQIGAMKTWQCPDCRADYGCDELEPRT